MTLRGVRRPDVDFGVEARELGTEIPFCLLRFAIRWSLRVDMGVEARDPAASLSEPPAPFTCAGMEFLAFRPASFAKMPITKEKKIKVDLLDQT